MNKSKGQRRTTKNEIQMTVFFILNPKNRLTKRPSAHTIRPSSGMVTVNTVIGPSSGVFQGSGCQGGHSRQGNLGTNPLATPLYWGFCLGAYPTRTVRESSGPEWAAYQRTPASTHPAARRPRLGKGYWVKLQARRWKPTCGEKNLPPCALGVDGSRSGASLPPPGAAGPYGVHPRRSYANEPECAVRGKRSSAPTWCKVGSSQESLVHPGRRQRRAVPALGAGSAEAEA